MKSPEKTAIRRSEELTRIAKKIFGDEIVEEAFFTTWDINNSSEEDIKKRIEYENVSLDKEEKTICISGTVVWIKFSSSNVVSFDSSEWGTIQCADVNNSYVI